MLSVIIVYSRHIFDIYFTLYWGCCIIMEHIMAVAKHSHEKLILISQYFKIYDITNFQYNVVDGAFQLEMKTLFLYYTIG